ncbi:MBL fold metallo-hydrolase [Sphingomonas sp. UNC305MFCol5.2]|uniref:MBL fold metallo-hydrolase n=1 Tax=Sphingomonas sp. UNC305MFCol5.2 TaxID=1449076 RepID=UPI0018CC1260|nr:MBL fold metallo-hydrolase [Sphingomonas sp. UNC305MFCol5.2]
MPVPLDLIFHGAAGTVTGSCMELRTSGRRLLIDCGLFQGSRSLEALNHEELPFDAGALDAVILIHTHLDHSGRLPLLTREGYAGPIWCTPPTRQLLKPLLDDAAQIQAQDAARRNDRPDRAGFPRFEPLYDREDVRHVVERTRGLGYRKWAEIVPGVEIRFHDPRHILGSASLELCAEGKRLFFSGDIGQAAGDPGMLADAAGPFDHIVCEATYGDRDRVVPTPEARREELAGIVERALRRGGNLLIPAFALERTQILLEDLVALFNTGRLEPVPVVIDSPLADRITRAYRRCASPGAPRLFDHPNVRFTTGMAQSQALYRIPGAVILAGSGMCTGGRIRHHLVRNLPRAESTVLFVGYQARGTLGTVLKSGAQTVRISGSDIRVCAEIATIDAYSAHADHAALLRFLGARGAVRGRCSSITARSLRLSASPPTPPCSPACRIPLSPGSASTSASSPEGRHSARANRARMPRRCWLPMTGAIATPPSRARSRNGCVPCRAMPRAATRSPQQNRRSRRAERA